MYWKLRLLWWRLDKGAVALSLFFALVVGMLATAASAVLLQREAQRAALRESEARSLDCLARNVYYEARGESPRGQYAVAEVTMNRTASRLYPRTVCEVVYQKNWDPLRKRYVGAFSWTELDRLDPPAGEAWQRAQKIAQDVYYRRHAPSLPGVLYYHATNIEPQWSSEHELVARIGRHVFYR
jgi:spore germination cell wall hydrolase CwlJ-like protein